MLVVIPHSQLFTIQELFTYNTTGGANWTSNSKIYCLYVNKAWNQTNNVIADSEYEYDLGKKGVPIHTNIISITPLNSTVKVGEYIYAYYNFSVFNNNNNTGLTDIFTNIYVNLSKYINSSIWQNTSSLDVIIPSLSHNSQTFMRVDVKNITAIQKSYGCSYADYQTWRKYECNFIVSVLENNITPNLPIIYEIPYNLLPDWNRRDKTATNWFVDGTTKNITYEEIDSLGIVRFYVDVYHSNSSLDEGDHTFTITYYIPTVYSGGGGGGGGGYVPQTNISFEVFPTEITILTSPGESKLIAPYGSSHTFSIKNLGINPIFISVEVLGDYKNYISLTNIAQFQIYQQPQYISVEPGKEVYVDFYTNVPLDAKSGSYQIIINFVERDSKVYKTVKINLLVGGPASILGKVSKILFYPINFSPNNTFKINKDGIYVRGMSEVSVPVGWLIVVSSLSIPYFITSHILKIRGGRINNKYKALIAMLSSLLVLVMVVYIMVV
jgi:hypothetical protein